MRPTKTKFNEKKKVRCSLISIQEKLIQFSLARAQTLPGVEVFYYEKQATARVAFTEETESKQGFLLGMDFWVTGGK